MDVCRFVLYDWAGFFCLFVCFVLFCLFLFLWFVVVVGGGGGWLSWAVFSIYKAKVHQKTDLFTWKVSECLAEFPAALLFLIDAGFTTQTESHM